VKKIFAILLLLSFSVQITGYHLFFHIKQTNIKKSARSRIRRAIEEGQVEQFVFTSAEAQTLAWEDDKEFHFKGEMYDVIEKKEVNGNVHIRCIRDKKETELVKNYQKITKDDFSGSSKKRTSLLLKLIATFYTPVSNPGMETFAGPGKLNWAIAASPLFFSNTEVLTPPPQFI